MKPSELKSIVKGMGITKGRNRLVPYHEPLAKGSEIPTPDVLLEKSDKPLIKSMQDLNDDLLIVSKILCCHPTQLKLWKRWERLWGSNDQTSELAKAVTDSMTTGNTGYGAEWVATTMSAQLIEMVEMQRLLTGSGLIQRFNMPSKIWELPAEASLPTVYKGSESTAATKMAFGTTKRDVHRGAAEVLPGFLGRGGRGFHRCFPAGRKAPDCQGVRPRGGKLRHQRR